MSKGDTLEIELSMFSLVFIDKIIVSEHVFIVFSIKTINLEYIFIDFISINRLFSVYFYINKAPFFAWCKKSLFLSIFAQRVNIGGKSQLENNN